MGTKLYDRMGDLHSVTRLGEDEMAAHTFEDGNWDAGRFVIRVPSEKAETG